MGASWKGNIQVVERLLNGGAQPNLQSKVRMDLLSYSDYMMMWDIKMYGGISFLIPNVYA